MSDGASGDGQCELLVLGEGNYFGGVSKSYGSGFSERLPFSCVCIATKQEKAE